MFIPGLDGYELFSGKDYSLNDISSSQATAEECAWVILVIFCVSFIFYVLVVQCFIIDNSNEFRYNEIGLNV